MNGKKETRLISCKVCKEVKEAFQDGFYPKGINRRWRDSDGRMFNGKVCPICNAERTKSHAQKKRLLNTM